MNILEMLRTIYIKSLKKEADDNLEIYYIGGSQILPPPLEIEEEERLLNRLGTDDNARQILVERNLRLVVYIAKKFENTGIRYRRFNINRNNTGLWKQ